MTDQDFADLINLTTPDFNEQRAVDLASELQSYECAGRLFKSDAVVMQDSGHEIDMTAFTTPVDSTEAVGLYHVDNYVQPDMSTRMRVEWRHVRTTAQYDRIAVAMNSGKRQIYNYLNGRDQMVQLGAAKKFEDYMWGVPDASDEVTPDGIFRYIVRNATEGFNGGAPTGFTTVCGVDPTTNARHRNWTFTYSDVSRADLIYKTRHAMNQCNFRGVQDVMQLRDPFGNANRWRIYTTETKHLDLEDRQREQNDNLGPDLAKMDGMVLIRGTPVVWVPWLTNNTSDHPFIGVNWGKFKVVALRSEWMRRGESFRADRQSSVWKQVTDYTYNLLTWERSDHFIGYLV